MWTFVALIWAAAATGDPTTPTAITLTFATEDQCNNMIGTLRTETEQNDLYIITACRPSGATGS